jgi:hypothetical protein
MGTGRVMRPTKDLAQFKGILYFVNKLLDNILNGIAWQDLCLKQFLTSYM